jgi:hypothetical protein
MCLPADFVAAADRTFFFDYCPGVESALTQAEPAGRGFVDEAGEDFG